MAIPITPKPQYPNVPIAPGVPPVLRQIGAIQNTIVTLVSDVARIVSLFGGPQWGLFTATGAPAFGSTTASVNIGPVTLAVPTALAPILGGTGQSVAGIEFRLDYQISTAPQEGGAFLSYNKVSTPFAARVTYNVSGTESQRAAFLQAVAAQQQSLSLLTLVMPEVRSVSGCNVTHYDFRRTAQNGVTMFAVDVWVEEVRVTGTAAYSNTQLPSGANQVNGGTVQPQTPTPFQQSGVTRVQ